MSIEKRHDMLLSTLTNYLNAAGEHPRVVVTVDRTLPSSQVAAAVGLSAASAGSGIASFHHRHCGWARDVGTSALYDECVRYYGELVSGVC